jgi:putative transposase
MTLPRSQYVKEDQEGVYHCFSRCVRRAFLYGFDKVTRRDFSHRKAWIVDRLQELACIFAIEVCAYAVMENHYHTVLRLRPDLVATWSDLEVATRWLTLFPQKRKKKGKPLPPLEKQIRGLVNCADRIAELRHRLSSLSWFMSCLNEFIARRANKEDQVKGRFWESRFKCQALLDDAAIAACMVYVDLNPIRTGLTDTPENSAFTSIQQRIRAWHQQTVTGPSVSAAAAEMDSEIYAAARESIPDRGDTLQKSPFLEDWLCPISGDSRRRGILQMTETEYFDLVERSGRIARSDKRGAIDDELAPILTRIGAKPETWAETVSSFGRKFHLAVGFLSSLRHFAHRLGRKWLTGVSAAQAAFALSPPQLT